MGETSHRTEEPTLGFLLALAVVAGVLATPPFLSLTFWVGHPWLTIPLFLRARDARARGMERSTLLRRSAAAGFVSGAVVGIGVAIVERWRTGRSLPTEDLVAHVVYPVIGVLFAVVAAAVGHRFGTPSSPSDR